MRGHQCPQFLGLGQRQACNQTGDNASQVSIASARRANYSCREGENVKQRLTIPGPTPVLSGGD